MGTFKSVFSTLVFGLVAGTLAGVTQAARAAEAGPGQLEVTFFAVGHGDSALYRGPCGEFGLIDANKAGAKKVQPALGGRPLKWIAASHYDKDHINGIVELGDNGVVPATVYDRGGDRDANDTATFYDYYDYVHSGRFEHVPVTIGYEFSLCEGADKVSFTVLWVASEGTIVDGGPARDENDLGLCLKVEYREFDLATCGDISGRTADGYRDVESIVAPKLGDVEVAKVNHHGSAYSSREEYVRDLDAQVSVVSVGRNSTPAALPSPTVLARWSAKGDLYQTQDGTGAKVDGDITIRTPGVNGFSVWTDAEKAWTQYPFDENRFSVGDATVTEGDDGTTVATFMVSRPLPGKAASVSVSIEGETAQAGTDFEFAPLALDFAPADTFKPVAVTVKGDDEKEKSETFKLKISATDSRLLRDQVGRGTIVNDDGRELKVLAKTGDSVPIGSSSSTLTGLGPEPSVNDDGVIAFVGRHSGGEGILVWEDDALRNINPGFSQNSSRTFGDAVQINNDGMVVARDRVAGAPPSFRMRVWDSHDTDDYDLVAVGGPSNPQNFTSVTGPASIGNAGDIAFIGATPWGTNLVTSAPPYDDLYQATLHSGLRPMVDDEGRVVVQVTGGSTTGDVLRVYSKTLGPQRGIACGTTVICAHPRFKDIGRAAGTSDDGTLVVFYGEEGVTAEPGRPGVFVSVEDATGGRELVRVAGVSGDGHLDPGETWDDRNGNTTVDAEEDRGRFTKFEADARVAVNRVGKDGGTATVLFTAYDTDNKKGLYSARIDPSSRKVDRAKPVLRVEDKVDGLDGTVADFSVFDPLNSAEKQETVVWAKTTSNVEAILHRRSSTAPLVVIPGAGGSELFTAAGDQRWPVLTEGQEYIGKHLNLKDLANRQLVPRDVIRAVPSWLPPWATPEKLGMLQFYGPLLEALDDHGYREYSMTSGGTFEPERRTAAGCDTTQDDPDLFVFAYDWRKDIADSAQKLQDFIGCVQQFHPGGGANILAHSMGGLVARRYIVDNPADQRVNALVTLGAPWLGASKMLNVLETGDFVPLVASGPGVKAAVETMPGLHQLLPGLGPRTLGAPAPLIEEGRDFDGNGRTDDEFNGSDLVSLLDDTHPGFTPGTVGREFHHHAKGANAQDDWGADNGGVAYYHLFGQESAETTPEQVSAVNTWRCLRAKFGPGGSFHNCHLGERLRLWFGRGDGTVSVVSATRRGAVTDLNHPAAKVEPVPGALQGHNAMLRNTELHTRALEWLDAEGGPTPPESASPFRAASAATAVEVPSLPSHWITVAGAKSVVVIDDRGNSTAPIDGTQLRGSVPGVEQYAVAEDTETIAMPAGTPIRTTFRSTGQPIAVEVLTSDGNGGVVAAVRYLDVELPTGVSALLESTGTGINEFRYDGNGDGTFETSLPATVSLAGAAAQDTRGPEVTITETVETGIARVTVTASDGGTGVKDLFLSVDGSLFVPYTGAVSVDPAEHPMVWALAGDHGGNRSVASLRLTPPPSDDAPVALNRAVETTEDTPVLVTFEAEHPQELPMTFKIVTEPGHGTLTGTDRTRTYMPAPNFSGTDQFTYVASDGTRDSQPATVTINVKPVNDAPVAADDSFSTRSDTPLKVAAPGVLGNDTDNDGDALRAELVTSPSQGTATLAPDGSLHFVPAAGGSGTERLTYRVSDGTAVSNTANVTITVTPSAIPPDCSAVRPNVASLWPANHKLQTVALTGARDGRGAAVPVRITGVSQDEPVNGLGDGDTAPDAEITATGNEVRLRAERSGTGDGRVYRLQFTATDAAGQNCTGSATVSVPHRNGAPAVDSSPPAFNSLRP